LPRHASSYGRPDKKTLCRIRRREESRKIRELSEQLRAELHQFVEMLSCQGYQYPIIEQRRVQGGSPLPEAVPEDGTSGNSS